MWSSTLSQKYKRCDFFLKKWTVSPFIVLIDKYPLFMLLNLCVVFIQKLSCDICDRRVHCYPFVCPINWPIFMCVPFLFRFRISLTSSTLYSPFVFCKQIQQITHSSMRVVHLFIAKANRDFSRINSKPFLHLQYFYWIQACFAFQNRTTDVSLNIYSIIKVREYRGDKSQMNNPEKTQIA